MTACNYMRVCAVRWSQRRGDSRIAQTGKAVHRSMANTRMRWEELLSTERLADATTFPDPSQSARRDAFQRDFDRVVYSPAFRRLQNKTQVHTLSNNDHVRNRLTHSLEASAIARSLGTAIGTWLNESKETPIHPSLFGSCAEAATIAHDIGNPPFGHPGEEAIRDWFKYSHAKEHALSLTDAEAEDFTGFNGNAQGFRILTKWFHGYDSPGLQLTCATLAAFTKYPAATSRENPFKERGLFADAARSYKVVAQRTGLPSLGEGIWARHPLAFVVEAADDIAYSTADIEDATELGLMASDDGKALFHRLMKPGSLPVTSPINRLRSLLIGELIDAAETEFRRDYECIISGQRHTSLLKDHKAYEALKTVAREQIFTSSRQLLRDVAGRDALNGLLKRLSTTICDFKAKGWSLPEMRKHKPHKWRLLMLVDDAFPETRPLSQLPPTMPDCEVLHIIVDYVTGQTDRYAVELWQNVRGLEL